MAMDYFGKAVIERVEANGDLSCEWMRPYYHVGTSPHPFCYERQQLSRQNNHCHMIQPAHRPQLIPNDMINGDKVKGCLIDHDHGLNQLNTAPSGNVSPVFHFSKS
jgi:hypothetical protein